jgi:protein arginine N-methyltransferase 5
LELDGEDLDEWICSRWKAEPIKTLIFPTGIFLINKKGFPVLSKHYQHFINDIMKMCDTFIISSLSEKTFKTDESNITLSSYREYLEHILYNQPKDGVIDSFANGYHDFLQAPLQPLLDNLQSATYQVFESDPVKYGQYELAIESALLDIFGPNSQRHFETWYF